MKEPDKHDKRIEFERLTKSPGWTPADLGEKIPAIGSLEDSGQPANLAVLIRTSDSQYLDEPPAQMMAQCWASIADVGPPGVGWSLYNSTGGGGGPGVVVNPSSAGIVSIRQNLTSVDVRFWRIETMATSNNPNPMLS